MTASDRSAARHSRCFAWAPEGLGGGPVAALVLDRPPALPVARPFSIGTAPAEAAADAPHMVPVAEASVAGALVSEAPAAPPPAALREPAPIAPARLELHCARVPFSFGAGRVPDAPGASRPALPGAAVSAGGGRLATDRVPELRVISRLPEGAETVSIRPHEGSGVLGMAVRDARGLHLVPLRCVDVMSGWFQVGSDRLGRPVWRAGEASLRLPRTEGAAAVELTLVALED